MFRVSGKYFKSQKEGAGKYFTALHYILCVYLRIVILTWLRSGFGSQRSSFVSQLAEALRIAKKAEPDHLVVERLAEVSASMPKKSVECLGMIVAGDKEGWGILGWRESARKILGAAMNSADVAAKAAAAEQIHRLGARGYFEFRELLPVALE